MKINTSCKTVFTEQMSTKKYPEAFCNKYSGCFSAKIFQVKIAYSPKYGQNQPVSNQDQRS